MKIIISGGRHFDNYQLLKLKCDVLFKNIKIDQIVSGGCKGADTLGERYARERGILVKRFEANWDANGKAAGVIRNEEMSQYADAIVAFWDGKSKGTANMLDKAKAKKLMIRIIKYA